MSTADDIVRKRVRFHAPGTEDVRVVPRIPYGDGSDHTLDVYYSPARGGELTPAVILVSGLSDHGAQRIVGCRINETGPFVSWARLLAVSGLAAITYATGDDPARDLGAVVRHLENAGPAIAIDPRRLGIFAVSSHVPNALGLLMTRSQRLRCAVLAYGFMLDLEGSTAVVEAQNTWRFANPASGRSMSDMPLDVPLLVVRAGADTFAGVNASIDAFVANALRHNLPLTLINHHRGPHGFDVDDDSDTSRYVIQQIVAFLRAHLSPAA